MRDFTYDDSQLQQMFAELEPRRRAQALRGGFKRAANQVRKTAIGKLRSKEIRTDRDLEKGIRAVVYKKIAGFKVTIATRKGKNEVGFHKNRRGLKKPVLIWAEEGTAERHTRKKIGRGARYTGKMPRLGFMAETLEATRGTTTESIHRMVADNVERLAKKYGCK